MASPKPISALGRGMFSLLLVFLLAGILPLLAASVTGAASRAPGYGRSGMVVSSSAPAAEAGSRILAAGGNAIDAAVATAFAVGVTQPWSAGIGGGAFILVRHADGTVEAVDARETAPAGATRDMFVAAGVAKHASRHGPLAVATPGMVRGLFEVHQKSGKLPWAQVLAPAIRLAGEGFVIGPRAARTIERMRRSLPAEIFPETTRIQFEGVGELAEPGDRLVQADLAKTLEGIAAKGPDAFYAGPVAKKIAAEVKRRGGVLREVDLHNYRAALREPISGQYRGTTVYSFPPPSSGGVALVEMLNTLSGYDLKERGAGSSASLHLVAEAMKLAFADRAAYLGDPDFVEIPVEELVSKAYAAKLRAKIDPGRFTATPWSFDCKGAVGEVKGPGLPADDAGTTHLSVTDGAGNAVAITATINTAYGSGITVPGTGIVLNNEMDDFSVAPDTPNVYGLIDTRGANAVAPGKRPLSSMTPTILVKDGRPFMVTGSPGGPRIITTVLLGILNVIDYGMNVQQAVSAPRFHHQWVPDKLFVEPATPADVVAALRACGHPVVVSKRNWSANEAIVLDPATGWQLGGSDPRTDGGAIGNPPTP